MTASIGIHGAVAWTLIENHPKAQTLGAPSSTFVEVSLIPSMQPVSPTSAAPVSSTAKPLSAQDAATAQPAADPEPATELAQQSQPIHMAPADAITDGESGAGRASTLNGDAVDLYGQLLMDHIRRYRTYPASARRASIEGQVVLKFEIDREGHVLDAYIEQSSGTPSLDAEALATINRAQPLPAIPQTLPDRLSLTLPITFNLRS